ncbi:MAG: hypothetical protein ABI592_06100 [Acidobacteriota bacterium]
MTRAPRFLALVLLTGGILAALRGASSGAGGPPPAAPPAGRAPGPEPVIVGEGVISTPDDEFGGTFSPDGRTMLYCKSIPRSQFYVILESHWEGSRWGAPRIAPFSGRWRDSDPVFSRDGRRVYFASDRPVAGADKKNFDIWFVERTATGWGEPANLGPPINSDQNEDFISFAADGTAYFTSGREGSAGGLDVWRSRLVEGKYATPENLGATINGKDWLNIEGWIADDESFLLVGAFGHPEGAGGQDIFVSYRNSDGSFGPLKMLNPKINTAAREYSPRVSLDGKSLFFSSERGMPTDVRTAPWTASEYEKACGSVRNGLGNIYRMALTDALAGTR